MCCAKIAAVSNRVHDGMDSTTIETIWQRWHVHAATHTPKLPGTLQGPVDDAELQRLQALDLPLPASLISSLLVHNGQRADSTEDFLAGAGRLLSADDMVSHRNMLRDALSEVAIPADDDVPAQTGIGPVRALTFCERWLPIADSNGDVTWYLDFDPLPTGKSGQVIRVDLEAGEWLVCADSYAQFLDDYVSALEEGRIKVKRGRLESDENWPPIERLPYLADSLLDESRVLEVGRSGRWDVAQRLVGRMANPTEALKLRIAANAEFHQGKCAKAQKALETLRALGEESEADRGLLLDVLEAQVKRPALQAELDAQIASNPDPRLRARRADLHREMAGEPPRKLSRADMLEWLAGPAGQQHHAVCLERAVADYRAARAGQDRDQWRLAEGECLLEMQRWEEAKALFTETVDRLQAALGDSEPEPWSPPAFFLDGAREGLRRAQTQDEGEAESMLGSMDELLGLQGEGEASDIFDELRSVRDTFARLHSDEVREKSMRSTDAGALDHDARNVAEQIVARHPDTPERLEPFPIAQVDRKAAKYYDKVRDQLLALGFEHLGDVESLNHRERSGQHIMIRIMRAPDALTIVAVWRLEGAFGAVDGVELESLLADGSIVLTNNTGAANPFAAPPLIAQQSLPQDCTLPLLVETHMRRLQDVPIAAMPIVDMEGVVALQERQRVINRDHARQQGWINEAELRGLLGASYRELGPRVQALLKNMR